MHRTIHRLARLLATRGGRRAFLRSRRLRRTILALWIALGAVTAVTYTDDSGHRHTCYYDDRFTVVPCTDGHVDVL